MPTDAEIVYSLKDLFALQLPTTPTIYNTTLTSTGWTEAVSGLTNVATWLLYNRGKHKTDYAFEASPSTFRTLEARAVLVEDTALTQLYVRGQAGDVIEVEVWEYVKPSS